VLEIGGGYELGEIAHLARIARPQVGVVTNVGPTHLERMGTIERIALNKVELVESLPEDGVAVLNADDPLVRPMAAKACGRVFFYGLTPEADLWADEIESQGLEGLRFRFHYGEEVVYSRVPLLGRHSVHTALRAAAVGLIEGLSWQEIMAGLRGATQLRLVVVPGLYGSTLLDDTYNSSPASAIAALNLLDELEGRKIAVLGDMLELGSYEEEGHRKVGRRAMDVAQLLLTVGPRGRIIAQEALDLGMDPQAIHSVEDNKAAIAYLRRAITPGDMVLIKGSRGMAMEHIVSALSVPENEAT
jgi:UDP-N-acetylmuramoyl-tripeptide--D-alanyl-D-alanine ligase